MKRIMLLMTVCGWWHNAIAQSQGGLEQYYYMDNKSVAISPIAWYQGKKGWYLEGRYNYDAEKALSVYAGKTFSKKSIISYNVSTLVGAVVGRYKGLSLAANTDLEYKRIYLSLQSQYTISLEDCRSNFIYNWCDIGYQLSSCLSAGLSMQQTNLYKTNAVSEKGIFMKADFGRWSFPLYVYNPFKNEKYGIMGLNFTWQYKNKIKNSIACL